MNKKIFQFVLFFTPLLLLTIFIFRSLLFNLSTNLLDWFDYPLMVWTIFQNVEHLRNLSLNGFFNSNIFYPFQGSLLFSDLLLTQSLMALPLSFFFQNKILVFN